MTEVLLSGACTVFDRQEQIDKATVAQPIVCLPLMRIPAPPEKPTKYLPEMWKPT